MRSAASVLGGENSNETFRRCVARAEIGVLTGDSLVRGRHGGAADGGGAASLALAAPDAGHQAAAGEVDRLERIEAGAAQPALDLVVGEAEMDVGVLALELDQIVRREIDHQDHAAGPHDAVWQLYVGSPTLIRGYDTDSFNGTECFTIVANGGCPVFDRLVGSRIGVINAEFRIPLFGTPALGIFKTSFLPIEVAPFFDAGVAWTSDSTPKFVWAGNTNDRVPVFSTGITARYNLLGYLVFETYLAHPFQRPGKNWVFGFNLLPGW